MIAQGSEMGANLAGFGCEAVFPDILAKVSGKKRELVKGWYSTAGGVAFFASVVWASASAMMSDELVAAL